MCWKYLLLIGLIGQATMSQSTEEVVCSPEEQLKIYDIRSKGLGFDHWSFSLLPGMKSHLNQTGNTRSEQRQYTYLTGDGSCPVDRKYPFDCPTHYTLHYDVDRIPQIMIHVRCSCQTRYHTGMNEFAACRPVMARTKIMRKKGCEYIEGYEELPVACSYKVIRPKRRVMGLK